MPSPEMGQQQAAEEQAAEVVIVSLGSTAGLRRSDDELRGLVATGRRQRRGGTRASPRPTRTMMLTDLAWARACRDAASRMLEQQRRAPARALTLIYSTTTAALLWPRPGAIRFDAPAASNRPGRHGLWQRPLELKRLRSAPLLLPCSEGAMSETPPSVRHRDGVLVVPIAVEPSESATPPRGARHRGHHLRRQSLQEGARPRARSLAAGARRSPLAAHGRARRRRRIRA